MGGNCGKFELQPFINLKTEDFLVSTCNSQEEKQEIIEHRVSAHRIRSIAC